MATLRRGRADDDTQKLWSFDSPISDSATSRAIVLPLQETVPILRPRIELLDTELVLRVRGFKEPWVISRDDLAGVADLDVLPDETDDMAFGRPVRVINYQTAAAWVTPDVLLLFKKPLQTPPVRRTYRQYVGFTSKECKTGAPVDGVKVNLANRAEALRQLEDWGVEPIDDPRQAMSEVAGIATDPAVIEEAEKNAKRLKRNARRIGIPFMYGVVMLGVARALVGTERSAGWILDRLALVAVLTAVFGVVLAAYGAWLRSAATDRSMTARRRWMAKRALPVWILVEVAFVAAKMAASAAHPAGGVSLTHGVRVLVNYLFLGWISGALFALGLLVCLTDWSWTRHQV